MGKTLFLLNRSQLVHAIKSNNVNILKQFYTGNYHKIETMVLKNGGTVEHAKIIYQESYIEVWKHVKTNRFIPQNETDLQNYLYKTAKNKCNSTLKTNSFKGVKTQIKTYLKDQKNNKDSIIDNLKSKKLEVTMETFKTLDLPSKELLKAFYFEKKPLHDIASNLNLKEDVTSYNKYRCMEKLRKMVFNSKQLEIETPQ